MIKLRRLQATNGAIDSASKMLKDLRDYLGYSFDIKDENLRGQLDAIADFQAKDGSFSVLDDPHMPSDAFVDFYIYPTVMCSAILMKAVLLYVDNAI